MAFPVLNATFQVFDSLDIFGASLCLIDLVCNTLSSSRSGLQFFKVWVIGGRCGLDERLQNKVRQCIDISEITHTSRRSGYLQIRWTGLIRNAGNSDLAQINLLWT